MFIAKTSDILYHASLPVSLQSDSLDAVWRLTSCAWMTKLEGMLSKALHCKKGAPAIIEGQRREAALPVEGSSPAPALDALSIAEAARIEEAGGPGADDRVHSVLLLQHAHRHARLCTASRISEQLLPQLLHL